MREAHWHFKVCKTLRYGNTGKARGGHQFGSGWCRTNGGMCATRKEQQQTATSNQQLIERN